MRDVSTAGHELSRAELTGLPDTLTLGELLQARIHTDVERYNADPGPVFHGLVQPADAMRYSDGLRMPQPRTLDAESFLAAARQAVAAGLLAFRLGDEVTADLSYLVDLTVHDEVTAVLRRPVVARSG